MPAAQLGEALGLHPRGTYDFFDALVAMHFLEREGEGPAGLYGNTPQTAAFLVKASPTYIGGMLEMLNARLLAYWNNLGTTLKTGQPQNEAKHSGALGLPPVAPHAKLAIAEAGLSKRIKVVSGDFFKDPLPSADVITMGKVLHDWNLEKKQQLIQSAFDALPKGGALIVIENLIDDARRQNAFGLPLSLNMLIETGDGFDDTTADFREWCTAAGFERFETLPLTGPTSAAVAYK